MNWILPQLWVWDCALAEDISAVSIGLIKTIVKCYGYSYIAHILTNFWFSHKLIIYV